jgi:hypothetical protein
VDLRDAGVEVAGELRDVRAPEHPGRDYDVLGQEAGLTGTDDVLAVLPGEAGDVDTAANGQVVPRRIGLEIVGHLARGWVRRARGREGHSRQPIAARRRVQPQRVPAAAPAVADALSAVEDDELPALPLEGVAGGEAGLAATDDDGFVLR